ncbi:MAG: hypothetical protein U0326_09740 [Polyangiales bacterium]
MVRAIWGSGEADAFVQGAAMRIAIWKLLFSVGDRLEGMRKTDAFRIDSIGTDEVTIKLERDGRLVNLPLDRLEPLVIEADEVCNQLHYKVPVTEAVHSVWAGWQVDEDEQLAVPCWVLAAAYLERYRSVEEFLKRPQTTESGATTPQPEAPSPEKSFVFHFDADHPRVGPNYAYSAWRAFFSVVAKNAQPSAIEVLSGDLRLANASVAVLPWLSRAKPALVREWQVDRDSAIRTRNIFAIMVGPVSGEWAKAADAQLQKCPFFVGCRPIGDDLQLHHTITSRLSTSIFVRGRLAVINRPDEVESHDPDLVQILEECGLQFVGYQPHAP